MTIIITAVGADRPGMVAALSLILADQQCNLEDCAMTRLGGQFAMILMVHLPADKTLTQIEPLFGELEYSHGLKVHCDEAEVLMAENEPSAPRHMLTVYAEDRPGLLSTISQILAENKVNITDVQTRLAAAGALYVMLFEVEISVAINAEDLEKTLQQAAQSAGMTLMLRAMDEDVL
ncbi:MAG: ACT domain-containing protein [Abditibacteriaceae bacterium]